MANPTKISIIFSSSSLREGGGKEKEGRVYGRGRPLHINQKTLLFFFARGSKKEKEGGGGDLSILNKQNNSVGERRPS